MSGKVFVTYEEIVRYLGGNCSQRNIVEGECVLNAGLVITVGLHQRNGCELKIMALVLQTSGLTKEPLQINGLISLTTEEKIEIRKFDCSCKAGQSEKCKHVAAVLWYLNRNDLNEIEELSSTDIKCMWNKKKKQCGINYSAGRIKNFCHVKTVAARPPVSQAFSERALKVLLASNPRSALALHKTGGQVIQEEGGLSGSESFISEEEMEL
ncbi:uncharacterized protein LOC124172369 [Ischnura elegans]|uniref:uncharacterized protein LOC124172369 n=1 Tax=Ischnura elegans TaxID=197161 RepID=UPI001ED89E2A|nr:uncharacterized protein LOC124172369 [Ischnura elegans]